jgi:hypothetical protein
MTRFSRHRTGLSLPDCIGAWRGLRCQQYAAIINNSTGAVEVTGITLTAANGWALVPYNYNMAGVHRLIPRLIGFFLNWRVNRHERSFRSLSLPETGRFPKPRLYRFYMTR